MPSGSQLGQPTRVATRKDSKTSRVVGFPWCQVRTSSARHSAEAGGARVPQAGRAGPRPPGGIAERLQGSAPPASQRYPRHLDLSGKINRTPQEWNFSYGLQQKFGSLTARMEERNGFIIMRKRMEHRCGIESSSTRKASFLSLLFNVIFERFQAFRSF